MISQVFELIAYDEGDIKMNEENNPNNWNQKCLSTFEKKNK